MPAMSRRKTSLSLDADALEAARDLGINVSAVAAVKVGDSDEQVRAAARAVGAPVVAILIWALFVSPRAVFAVHPFVRAFVELLVYAAATIVWWTSGNAWIGLAYAVVAVTVGLVAGRRRLA